MNNQLDNTQKTFKILAVDDNTKNIQILGTVLRQQGYNVAFALNGKQALTILEGQEEFDLILLDVNMPVMDGFETCRNIRRNKRLNDIPIIFLTALNDIKDIIEGFETGGQDYVVKPFNANELLARVKTHLELKHSKDLLKNINLWQDKKINERTKELFETNKKLEIAYNELQKLDNTKTGFLRLISHEINTPVNGILGFTELLKDNLKTSEYYDMIDGLLESARRLERFVKVCLYITQLQTMGKTVEKEQISIAELMQMAQSSLEKEIQLKELQLESNNGCDQDILICGNPKFLIYCFESILRNAVQYSPPKGIIKFAINMNNGKAICSISDQGDGFSELAMKNLFKTFATIDEHIENNKGLDLALAKLILEVHQGTIQVKNNAPKGATVTFEIPADC